MEFSPIFESVSNLGNASREAAGWITGRKLGALRRLQSRRLDDSLHVGHFVLEKDEDRRPGT